MTTGNMNTAVLVSANEGNPFDQAQMAAAAFLARYSGRTLETYRYDLRTFFQWCADVGLEVLEAKRAHIELWRAASEERGLAASTICGFYRFAHIDGRIAANPAQYVHRPKVYPGEGRGLDRGELGTFLFTAERYDRDHAALAVLLGLNGLRVSEACATDAEDLGFDRGHRTLRIIGKSNKPAVIPWSRGWPAPSTWPSASARRSRSCTAMTVRDSTGALRTAGCAPSARGPGSGSSTPTCSGPPSSWPPSMPACRYATCRSPPGRPIRGRRRSMTAEERTSTATLPTLWWPSWPGVSWLPLAP